MTGTKTLKTIEAIKMRRSIRKYKPDPVPDRYTLELLESARLAPSESNSQPWRFKVVKDTQIKQQLAEAAFDQSYIAGAPVVIVCCADIQAYIDGTISTTVNSTKKQKLKSRMADVLVDRAGLMMSSLPDQIGLRIAANVVIAIEHMVLRALDFGLGTCWTTMVDGTKVNRIFGWNDNIFVVALLPVGYPVEVPKPQKRLPLKKILIE